MWDQFEEFGDFVAKQKDRIHMEISPRDTLLKVSTVSWSNGTVKIVLLCPITCSSYKSARLGYYLRLSCLT